MFSSETQGSCFHWRQEGDWAIHVTGFMRVPETFFQSTRDYWQRVWVRMSYTGEFYIVRSDYITRSAYAGLSCCCLARGVNSRQPGKGYCESKAILDRETKNFATSSVFGRCGATVACRLPAPFAGRNRGHSANLWHDHVGT